jgi:hypothetical protein
LNLAAPKADLDLTTKDTKVTKKIRTISIFDSATRAANVSTLSAVALTYSSLSLFAFLRDLRGFVVRLGSASGAW